MKKETGHKPRHLIEYLQNEKGIGTLTLLLRKWKTCAQSNIRGFGTNCH